MYFGKVKEDSVTGIPPTHKSYSRFMTNFSIPSIALSNSTSDAFFHTSHSRIRSEMNFDHDQVTDCIEIYAQALTFRKSLINLTWSLIVNVRFAKLLRNLNNGEHLKLTPSHSDVRPEVLGHRLGTLHLHLVQELLEVKLWWLLLLVLTGGRTPPAPACDWAIASARNILHDPCIWGRLLLRE